MKRTSYRGQVDSQAHPLTCPTSSQLLVQQDRTANQKQASFSHFHSTTPERSSIFGRSIDGATIRGEGSPGQDAALAKVQRGHDEPGPWRTPLPTE